EPCSFLLALVGLEFQAPRVRFRQPVSNGTHRTLQLHSTVKIIFQQTYTEGTQLWDNLAAYHSERFRRVTGDEHTLSFSEQVADEISDGVRFPCAGGSRDENSARMLELARNPDLFGIGGLAEEDVRVLLRPRARAVRAVNVRRRRFKAHDIQKRPG